MKVVMQVANSNTPRLMNLVSAMALALLFVASLSTQGYSQNKQATSWSIEASDCLAPETLTQDDQPWANNSAIPARAYSPKNRDASAYCSLLLATFGNSLHIRAPPHIA